LNSLY